MKNKTEKNSALLLYQPWFRIMPLWMFLTPICLLMLGCSVTPSSGEHSAIASVDGNPGNARQGWEYRIGPEDVLNISVWREDTLQGEVVVRPDGGISFPLAGVVWAAGKTSEELQAEITQRLEKYIPAPVVTVSVVKVAGYRIYVLGQVKDPGQFAVGHYVDVLQALSLAGGLTPYASENNIKILRRENGQEIIFPFSYSAIKNGENLRQNIVLKSGDTVIVP